MSNSRTIGNILNEAIGGFPDIQKSVQYVYDTTFYIFNNTTPIYSPELRFPNLTTVSKDLNIGTNTNSYIYSDTVSFPVLQTVGGLFFLRGGSSTPYITSLDLSSLTTVGNSPLASALTSGYGLTFSNIKVSTLSLPALTSTSYIEVTGCTSLTSVSFAALTTIFKDSNGSGGGMNISGSSLLTTITLSALTTIPTTNPGNYYFNNNALNVTTVNAILTKFAAIAPTVTGTGRTLDLSGGTNAAPTGAGLTAKSTLQSGGWTVTTN